MNFTKAINKQKINDSEVYLKLSINEFICKYFVFFKDVFFYLIQNTF